MGIKMLSVALAAIALGAVTVAPASAAEGNPVVEIVSAADGMCAQLQVEAAPDWPRPVLRSCTEAPAQRWEQIPAGGGKVILRSTTSRDCLEAGAGVNNFWCDDRSEYQQAELVPDAGGTVRIKYGDEYVENRHSSMWMARFADSDRQRWRVRQVGTTTPPADTAGQVVRIEAVALGYGCLTVDDRSVPKPTPCADVAGQKFQRIELDGGGTALRSLANGKCLHAEDGAEVIVDALAECDTLDAGQSWKLDRNVTGAFRVRSGERVLTPGDERVWAAEEFPPTFMSVQIWHVTAA
jgi:hypothetical protein